MIVWVNELLHIAILLLDYLWNKLNSFDYDNDYPDYFSVFLNLVNYKTIELDSTRINLYSKYFYAVASDHEYVWLHLTRLVSYTKDNSISQLSQIFKQTDESDDWCIQFDSEEQNLYELISYISKHFYEADIEKVKEFPSSMIKGIFSNPSLQKPDEDSFTQLMLMSSATRTFSSPRACRTRRWRRWRWRTPSSRERSSRARRAGGRTSTRRSTSWCSTGWRGGWTRSSSSSSRGRRRRTATRRGTTTGSTSSLDSERDRAPTGTARGTRTALTKTHRCSLGKHVYTQVLLCF